MACYGRNSENERLAGQEVPRYPQTGATVESKVELACDIVEVELTAPAVPKGALDKVPGHYSLYYQGDVVNAWKGRLLEASTVEIHVMKPGDQQLAGLRSRHCSGWSNDAAFPAPSIAAPQTVVFSGDAFKFGSRYVLFVDPCGLAHPASAKIKRDADAPEEMLGAFLARLPMPIAFNVPAPITGAPVGPFPYNLFFYYLDLAVLNYNFYAQSLVFPWDPFYEKRKQRSLFIDQLYTYLEGNGRASRFAELNRECLDKGNISAAKQLSCIRGPDIVSHMTGADFDPLRRDPDGGPIDPLLTRYSQIDPSRHAVISNQGTRRRTTDWRFFAPARELISYSAAYMVYRSITTGSIVLDRLRMQRSDPNGPEIFVFEGVSGSTSTYGSLGQMGFVVKRRQPDGSYVLDISFRGSRSGGAGSAIVKAALAPTLRAAARLNGVPVAPRVVLGKGGNPDWISDLWVDFVADSTIASSGKVHIGYARIIRWTMPYVLATLGYIHNQSPEQSPVQIYVTGHSMGGGLATLFASTMINNAPGSYRRSAPLNPVFRWSAWSRVKLLAYSAPIVGDADFAAQMNVAPKQPGPNAATVLVKSPANPVARVGGAADFGDVTVMTKALASDEPAMYRILHPDDPIGLNVVASLRCAVRARLPGVGKCYVGSDLLTREAKVGRIPSPNYHETFWLYKNMRRRFSGTQTAPDESQQLVRGVMSTPDEGASYTVSQFYSVNYDATFDLALFDADIKFYVSLHSYGETGRPNAPKYDAPIVAAPQTAASYTDSLDPRRAVQDERLILPVADEPGRNATPQWKR
jgi:hypothetical protein